MQGADAVAAYLAQALQAGGNDDDDDNDDLFG
jgi:hypothetical protein